MVATKLATWKAEGKYVGKFAAQHHFFGYEGRCAAPSNYDADYCYSLGYTASMLIANGKTGYMSSVRNTTAPAEEWIAGGVPITMIMYIRVLFNTSVRLKYATSLLRLCSWNKQNK